MPRGFVNRRDRFRWDNVHFPDGENPLSSDSVTYDGQNLTSALDRLKEGIVFLDATPGASVTFLTADVAPLKKLSVWVVPTQSGSGDPAPDNVRPISGYTKCTVSVSDGVNTPTDYEIPFGDVGTVYGGTLDVVTGKLEIMCGIKVFDGTETFEAATTQGGYVYKQLNPPMRSGSSYSSRFAHCDTLPKVNSNSSAGVRFGINNANFYFQQTDQYCTDGTKDALIDFLENNNVTITYPLATTITVQLTPEEVYTIVGTNVVSADTGDIQELTYQDTFTNEIDLIWQAIEALQGNRSITPTPDDQKKAVTDEEPAEEIVEEQPVKKTTRKKTTE